MKHTDFGTYEYSQYDPRDHRPSLLDTFSAFVLLSVILAGLFLI